MRYTKINPQLFIDNRQKLFAKLHPNSIAILNSNDQFPRNGDQLHIFRQNSDILWASGLDQEKTIILLFPDCKKEEYKEIAFIIKSNKEIAIWQGHKYSKEEATEVSGIKNIMWLDEFNDILEELSKSADYIYLNEIEYQKFDTEVPYRDIRFKKWIQEKYNKKNYERLAPVLAECRLQKHPIEIVLLKEACRITEKAFYRLLNNMRPNMYEFEIQAEIDYEFTVNKANGHAYKPIIASGKKALCLHYTENNSLCKNGDLILLDFGAEYANYAADLSRTIPVNGHFSQRQRQCYEAVLEIWKKAKTFFTTGTSINHINDKVNKLMQNKMIELGLFTSADIKKQNPESPLFKKYFMHGTSHFIGLDVHDAGTKETILKEGMVLSCEPGLYIPEENIGIRIETDILITKNGPIDLLEDVPVEIAEIEQLMHCASGNC